MSPTKKQPGLRRSKRKSPMEVEPTTTSSSSTAISEAASSAAFQPQTAISEAQTASSAAFQPQSDPADKMVQDIIDHVLNNVTFKIGSPKKRTAKNSKKKGRTQAEMIADRLIEIGDKPIDGAGNCARAAIFKGFIKMNWEPSDLDQIIHTGQLIKCHHTRAVTLRELLKQPDYAGIDYVAKKYATVRCTEKRCNDAVYVTGLCSGKPRFDDGQAHNHCNKCKSFGECLWNYGVEHCDDCGKHFVGWYFDVLRTYKCECKDTLEEKQRNKILEMVEDLNLKKLTCYDLEARLQNSPYWIAALESEEADWMAEIFDQLE